MRFMELLNLSTNLRDMEMWKFFNFWATYSYCSADVMS